MTPRNGAGDETRTRDNHVGNVGLYQLSYSRLERKRNIEMAKNSVKMIVLFAALISVVLTGCSDS